MNASSQTATVTPKRTVNALGKVKRCFFCSGADLGAASSWVAMEHVLSPGDERPGV